MSVLLTDKVLHICQNSGFGRGVPNGKVDRWYGKGTTNNFEHMVISSST
jgi:hypothetical protein